MLNLPKTQKDKTGPLLADGAMGTYFSRLTGLPASQCELSALEHPETITLIHKAYLEAGANVLRTNTFALQPSLSGINQSQAEVLIEANFRLAMEAADERAIVLADFGPNHTLDTEEAYLEYLSLIDVFTSCGAKHFLFETFPDIALLPRLAAAIRARTKDSVIIASLAFSADGFTRKGQSIEFAMAELASCSDIDVLGMNCGIGPVHMQQLLNRCSVIEKPFSLMPNAGYPSFQDQQPVFTATAEYFAQATAMLAGEKTAIIGGCCGTTPEHIRALRAALDQPRPKPAPLTLRSRTPAVWTPVDRPMSNALNRSNKALICEMDPPKDSHLEQLVDAARALRSAGVDIMTFADAPLSRVRLDPVTAGARIQRETGLPAMPHLCCRDRNVNSLRSALLALHSENIRQVLLITGDPVPENDRGYIKPVFNLNSISLIEMAAGMNSELFAGDELLIGAAFDPNVVNPDAELRRAEKKLSAGASFLMTQPVYSESAIPVLASLKKLGAKILCGLMPPISYRNANYLANEVPGIRIPQSLLARFSQDQTPEEALAVGLSATLEAARVAAPAVDGFYLISPFNRLDIAVRLTRLIIDNGLLSDRTNN